LPDAAWLKPQVTHRRNTGRTPAPAVTTTAFPRHPGRHDAVTLSGPFTNTLTVNGNNDTVTESISLLNNVTLGNGNNDTVTVDNPFTDTFTVNGNGNSVSVTFRDRTSSIWPTR
jgi:hypothetical protein